MTQDALPKPLLDLWLEIDHIKRQLNKTTIVSVPNQNLSETSSVTFAAITITANGTWLPTYVGSTTAGVYTYSVQNGYYNKISGIVFFWGRVAISAIGTPPVGVMRIGGLPFPSAATYFGGISFGRISQFNYTALSMQLMGYIGAGGQYIQLEESFDNGAVVDVPAANFTNVLTELFISGVYLSA